MYVSEPWSCKDPCCLWEGQRALGIHKKYLNLCSEDERRSYGFGMTWRWVVNDRINFFCWTIPLSSSVFVVLMFVSLSLSWSSPELEPSQIRLIVYQDCERRGRNVLFDSDARKRSTEDAPVTVSAVRTRGLISSNNSISWLWVCKHSFTFTWLKACPALCHVCWLLVVLCHEAVGAVQKPVLQKPNIFHTCSCHLTAILICVSPISLDWMWWDKRKHEPQSNSAHEECWCCKTDDVSKCFVHRTGFLRILI